MPALLAAVAHWKEHGHRVRLVLISWDLLEGGRVDDVAVEVANWMHEHGATHDEHTLLYTGSHEELVATLQLPVGTIPQSALRDQHGVVIRRWPHAMSEADLAEVERLMAPAPSTPKVRRPAKPGARRSR
jgi:hypothetical protein